MGDRVRDPIIIQLQEARKLRGLSIAKLAAQLGWANIVLGSYERGDRNATLGRIRQWAAVLGFEIAALGTTRQTDGSAWLEYAARYKRSDTADGTGLIECGDADEAIAVAACMHSGEVVWRRVTATEWSEHG